MKLIKIFTFCLIYFIAINVYAIDIPECTTSEMTRLKELANNVKFKRSYEMKVDEAYEYVDLIYNIDVINYADGLRIYYKPSNDEDEDEYELKKGEKLEGYMAGEKIKITIKSYTPNYCTNKVLKTTTITLPVYNKYYYFNKDKCQKYPKFKYCTEFMDIKSKSFDEIDKLLDTYIKSGNNDTKDESFNYIWLVAIGAFGIVVAGTIVIIIIKKKKHKEEI